MGAKINFRKPKSKVELKKISLGVDAEGLRHWCEDIIRSDQDDSKIGPALAILEILDRYKEQENTAVNNRLQRAIKMLE